MVYQYPQPGYAAAPPRPGGGAAITAGVLGLLQGLAITGFAVFGAIMTRKERAEGYEETSSLVAVGVLSTVGSLLLVAAILLFCRRKAGRYILMVWASLTMVAVAFIMVMTAITDDLSNSDVVAFSIMLSVVVLIELPMLVCTAMSSTGRWIAARTHTGAPVAAGYPQPTYHPYY